MTEHGQEMNDMGICQMRREVPGLTPDVPGTQSQIERDTNFVELTNQVLTPGVMDRNTKHMIVKVVGGVIRHLENLPPQLVQDLRTLIDCIHILKSKVERIEQELEKE